MGEYILTLFCNDITLAEAKMLKTKLAIEYARASFEIRESKYTEGI